MKDNILSRKELHDLVWSKPMSKLANEYSISDTGLRKICIKHNIPLPMQGHWQKVKFGKETTQQKLPFIENDQVQINLETREEEKNSKDTYLSRYLRLKKEVENDKNLKLTVPDKLNKPHPLIIKVRDDLKDKEPGTWNNTNGLLISSKDVLTLEVSKANVSRALRFMNSLIFLLEQRKHSIVIEGGKTFVNIHGEKLQIRCREVHKRVLIEKQTYWDRYDNIPSGRLKLMYEDSYPKKEWADGKKILLEDQLSKIITFFEIKVQRQEREEWKKQYEIQRKKEKDFQKLQDQELHDFQQLLTNSDLLFKAENMRSYINKVKEISLEKGNYSTEIDNWIDWANRKANWLDPLHDFKEDDLLSHFKNSYLKKEKQKKPWER